MYFPVKGMISRLGSTVYDLLPDKVDGVKKY